MTLNTALSACGDRNEAQALMASLVAMKSYPGRRRTGAADRVRLDEGEWAGTAFPGSRSKPAKCGSHHRKWRRPDDAAQRAH